MSKQYLMHPGVKDQASNLWSRGGPFQRAADSVVRLVGRITLNEDPLVGLKTTNNGETRIENCVKYDLTSACRLVTVSQKNKVFILFVGDHEDEEKWLNRNKGAKFAEKNGMVEIIPMPSQGGEPIVLAETTYSQGKLYEQLSVRYVDYVTEGFTRSVIRKIEDLHSLSGEEEILHIYGDVQLLARGNLFFDVFIALMRGDKEGAVKRIELEKGQYTEISEKPVVSGEQLYVIPENDPTYAQLFEHFVKTADYKQWMLFMHPLQQEIVDIDYKSSGKLLGVSGSGKTCILVKRAVRLAKKYPDGEILLVTLNRSLANLIRELVDVVVEDGVGERLHVKPFFVVCQEYLQQFEPASSRIYDDVTWKSLEHIDEVWEEFYRCENNNHDAAIMHSVHDYLIASNVNAQSYIREEFDWIRSAIAPDDRERYLKIPREGRAIPLNESYRKMLLSGLSAWERKMTAVGITDYLGLASALYKYKGGLAKKFRCVLIDESQDFGTAELSILREITFDGENDLFLCGDAAQRVSTKFQSLKDAGIAIHSASSNKIVKNYRNSREILEAAYVILSNNIPDGASKTEDFEVLDPEFSSRSGPTPVVIKSSCFEAEICSAIFYASQEVAENPSWKACVAICGYSSYEVSCFGEKIGVAVLDNNAKLSDSSVFLSDLEQTKGFEFDVMIIINASLEEIPPKNSDERERLKDLTQFYVALTRAKIQLVVSYNNQPSVFLKDISEYFLEGEWKDYLDQDVGGVGVPSKTGSLRLDVNFPDSILFMTGQQLLYTDHAMGMSGLLIEKLRSMISGKALIRGRSFVEWKNIGSAYDSCRNDVKSRQAFGPEGCRQFIEMCNNVGIDMDIKSHKKEDIYRGEVASDSSKLTH